MRMRPPFPTLLGLAVGVCVSSPPSRIGAAPQALTLQPNSLCEQNERIIFSCPLKSPAKTVSVCGSKELTSEQGYLQYRFGVPGKIELEFPKDRKETQKQFQYTHYFRAQVDRTEINFGIDAYSYSVFDDYDGEQKPAVSRQGITVSQANGAGKETTYLCRAKPKADYSDLQAVLPSGQQ